MRDKHLRILIIGLLASLIVSATAVVTNEFPFGVYSLLHNSNKYFGENRGKIAEYMKLMGYNFTVMQTNNSDTDLDGLLAVLAENDVDAVLSDKCWSNDPADSRHYAMLALSTSNFQRFEAEFSDAKPVKAEDINQSSYWYGSVIGKNNPNAPKRTGVQVSDPDASYEHAWQCSQKRDKAGYAFTDITYRWENRRGESVKMGQGFLIHNTHQISIKDTDSLYVKYRIKLDKINPSLREDEVLFSFSPMGYLGRATEFADSSMVKHSFAKQTGFSSNFTVRDFKALGQPKGYFDLELRMSYNDLRESGLLTNDFSYNPSADGNWWWYGFRGFSPRLYWNGNCDLSLDYLELEDQIHRNFRTQPDVYRSRINQRLRELTSLPHGNIIRNFYPLDEPYQTHQNSFRELNSMIDSDLPTMFTASYDIEHQEFLMGDGKSYFDQVSLVREQMKPSIIAPDIYPMKPGINFNQGQGEFIQTVFDKKLLKVYQECKDYSLEQEGREFYPIVQTFGRWNGKQWVSWVLPPKATQKAMLYLPFCYGLDGLMSYLFTGLLNAKGEGDYAQCLAYDMNPLSTDTHTWDVVSELNPKLKYYGSLIQGWKWLFANTIQTEDAASQVDVKTLGIEKLNVQQNGNGIYEGYIQCGYYLDEAGMPAIFAVNRRTDYLKDVAITDKRNSSIIPPSEYQKYYAEFAAQDLKINLIKGAYGSFPAVLDPLDSFLAIADGNQITVSLAAGEGKMLKLVSTLPANLKKGNYTLKNTAVLKDKVVLNKKSNVTCEGDLHLLENCTLVLKKGSSLTVTGKIIQAASAKIESEGRLIIAGD